MLNSARCSRRDQLHREAARWLICVIAALIMAGCAARRETPEPSPSRLQIYPVASQCDAWNINLLAIGGAPSRTTNEQAPFDDVQALGAFASGDVAAKLAPLSFAIAALASPFVLAKDLIEAPIAIPASAAARARAAKARSEYDDLIAAHRAAGCPSPTAYAARPDVQAASARFDRAYANATSRIYETMIAARFQLRGGFKGAGSRDVFEDEVAVIVPRGLNAANVVNPFGGAWSAQHVRHFLDAEKLVERFRAEGHCVDRWTWMTAVRAAMMRLPSTFRCGGYSDIAAGLNALPWNQGVGVGWNRVQVKRFFKRYEREGASQGVAVNWPPRTWPLRQPDLCRS